MVLFKRGRNSTNRMSPLAFWCSFQLAHLLAMVFFLPPLNMGQMLMDSLIPRTVSLAILLIVFDQRFCLSSRLMERLGVKKTILRNSRFEGRYDLLMKTSKKLTCKSRTKTKTSKKLTRKSRTKTKNPFPPPNPQIFSQKTHRCRFDPAIPNPFPPPPPIFVFPPAMIGGGLCLIPSRPPVDPIRRAIRV